MKIIRVFPRKTSYTPDDSYSFIGMPPFIIPDHDEVHISCTFTWDKEWCKGLQYQWQGRTDKPVKLGGWHSEVKLMSSLKVCISSQISFSQQEGVIIIAHGA